MSFETRNFIPTNTIDTLPTIEIVDKPEHECGLALIYSTTLSHKTQLAYAMGLAVQHRGQNAGGMAVCGRDGVERRRGEGLLEQAIPPSELEHIDIPAWWAMTHVRYGTNGDYNYENIQPSRANAPGIGEIYVAVNGNIPAAESLRSLVPYELDASYSDTNIAAHVLANMPGATMDEKVQAFADLPQIKGSANNMFIAVGRTVYVMRDQFGLHPLVIGEHEGATVITSETVGLQKIGADYVSDFPPGGIMKLDENGPFMIREQSQEMQANCAFEGAYFSSPLSNLNGMSVLEYRMRCGQEVARELLERGVSMAEIDHIIGMPDSGVPFAHGLAEALTKPYRPYIIRSHYEEGSNKRTFMQDAQRARMTGLVQSKLMLMQDRSLWEGKKIIIADDSLVRGTNARTITEKAKNLGALEVHWVLGYPPVVDPCHLGVSFRSKDELIAAYGKSWEQIAAEIGASSVTYISPHGLVRAHYRPGQMPDLPQDATEVLQAHGYCAGCITGKHPVGRDGTIYRYSN